MRRFAIAAAAALLAAPLAHAEVRIVVFAAASYGGSMALAKRLIAGAPADVFISTDEASMEEATKGNAVKAESRVDFLSNALVLVAPNSAAFDSLSLQGDALAKALGDRKIATGDGATVPAAKYAKTALTELGLWDAIEPHLALTTDALAALAFVDRGEAPLGIVNAADATAETKVKIVATRPPILYPTAITDAAKTPEAAKFEDYLKGADARAVFAAQGVSLPK